MRYIYSIVFVIAMTSCQKVIDVKLQSSEAQYVIVGTVTGQVSGCEVSITETKSFGDDNNFPGISGATVTIENNGVTDTLHEGAAGVYRTETITGVPGDTYSLTVAIGSQVFKSTSRMPQPVALDSMYVSTAALSNKNFVTVIYQDPSGIANYYHFVQYVNGKKEKSIFVSDDEFTDGQRVKSQLNYSNDTDDKTRDIKNGDSVRIDMICVDPAVYKYWYSLNNGATGTSQSSSPGNPISNITGGAVMGYFSAQTLESRTILVR